MRTPKEAWNFAYGGNMSPRVLIERRSIRPLESLAGSLEGYRLVFNARGFPWIEPVFANIEPAIGRSVHGVLHLLTHDQFVLLDRFEGVGLAYRHLKVEVTAYDSRKVCAQTYSAIIVSERKKPSCRYLKYLREGARHYQLDPAYIEMLDACPCRNTPRLPEFMVLLGENLVKRGSRLSL